MLHLHKYIRTVSFDRLPTHGVHLMVPPPGVIEPMYHDQRHSPGILKPLRQLQLVCIVKLSQDGYHMCLCYSQIFLEVLKHKPFS